MPTLAATIGVSGESQLATIDWYNGNFGYIEADCPSLAVCYKSGRMQLMRNAFDTAPILIDALMTITAAR